MTQPSTDFRVAQRVRLHSKAKSVFVILAVDAADTTVLVQAELDAPGRYSFRCTAAHLVPAES